MLRRPLSLSIHRSLSFHFALMTSLYVGCESDERRGEITREVIDAQLGERDRSAPLDHSLSHTLDRSIEEESDQGEMISDISVTDMLVTDMQATDMQAIDMQAIDMQATDMEMPDLGVDDMQVVDLDVIDAAPDDMDPSDMRVIDATLEPDLGVPPMPPQDCFPEARNDNRVAERFSLGPHTEDTRLCDEMNASMLDQQGAELGYEGERSIWINQHEVSGCLVADFGQQCQLDEHIGVGVAFRAIADACSAIPRPTPGQCDVEAVCGDRPGASALLFAASEIDDPRFISRVGSCGESYFFSTLTPIQSFSEVSDLESVRYVLICRPRQGCDADQADLSIDALYLIWR